MAQVQGNGNTGVKFGRMLCFLYCLFHHQQPRRVYITVCYFLDQTRVGYCLKKSDHVVEINVVPPTNNINDGATNKVIVVSQQKNVLE